MSNAKRIARLRHYDGSQLEVIEHMEYDSPRVPAGIISYMAEHRRVTTFEATLHSLMRMGYEIVPASY